MAGFLTVITGCMFSGKTLELIRQIEVAGHRKQTVRAYKPHIDKRYSKTHIVSHMGKISFPAVVVKTANDILEDQKNSPTDLVAIEEAQFFDNTIISVCETILEKSDIVMSGLGTTSSWTPFGPMPILLARADKINHLTAICTVCQSPATRTYRLSSETSEILVGADDKYEARCHKCCKKQEA